MPQRARAVYQFKMELLEVDPPVWRQIQVPETYSFWDLHVAIQDGIMCWRDYHLHEFAVIDPSTGNRVSIGIPDEDFKRGDAIVLPGWDYRIANYFSADNRSGSYTYDFGGNWQHVLTFEGVFPRVPKSRCPRCLDGARACPPEGCGGAYGYEHLLRVLRTPSDEGHESMRAWVGEDFDPEVFNAEKVRFSDPHARWLLAFVDA